MTFTFTLEKRSSFGNARAARVLTSHGEALTPIFMPVATQAAVRSIDSEFLRSLNFPILLANTYHLNLRPGCEVFERFKGIHQFMRWPNAVLTDSGGFQIYSLNKYLKMEEEGAHFRSYVDGTSLMLTPERSIGIQTSIGSDIMMALDECVSSTSDKKIAEAAVQRTFRWAKRSLKARSNPEQALFGIVQGALYPDLRKQSIEQICSLSFDGFAVGGLAVGEEKSSREDTTEYTASALPQDKPRYLMGVGTPIDILEAVHRGIDMFDCILPTALAQTGVCFTSHGKLDLNRSVHKFSEQPLDAACACPTCSKYSRAYVHHLVKAKEYWAGQLLGMHNLWFYKNLMTSIRAHIMADTFEPFYKEARLQLVQGDIANPVKVPVAKRKKIPERVGNFTLLKRADGSASIKQISSEEVMHPGQDPMIEARELYVEQSGLKEKLLEIDAPELVLWDVGLGAATNAMAAVQAFEELASKHEGKIRALKIVSFECDMDALKLALYYPSFFAHLRHQAPVRLLENAHWKHKSLPITWELRQGDFMQERLKADLPQILFYDPFSAKSDTPLWMPEAFSQLQTQLASSESMLLNYTASTAVRATMLTSGFWVAEGAPTGAKKETTVAFSKCPTSEHWKSRLLGDAWLSRWERSDAKYPAALGEQEREKFCDRLRNHAQFCIKA